MKFEIEIAGGRYDGLVVKFEADHKPLSIVVETADLEESMGEKPNPNEPRYTRLNLQKLSQGEFL